MNVAWNLTLQLIFKVYFDKHSHDSDHMSEIL